MFSLRRGISNLELKLILRVINPRLSSFPQLNKTLTQDQVIKGTKWVRKNERGHLAKRIGCEYARSDQTGIAGPGNHTSAGRRVRRPKIQRSSAAYVWF